MLHRVPHLLTALLGSTSAFAGPLLTFDFNKENPWKQSAATFTDDAQAIVEWAPVGTIDEYRTDRRTGALRLEVNSSAVTGPWQAALVSGPLELKNIETDLAKLTLGFMLSVSTARPVEVRIESLDAAGAPTGELTGRIYPAAPDFYQRYSIDLSTLTATGDGKFDPTAPAVRLSFGVGRNDQGSDWPTAMKQELRLDNVCLASPAYYVSAAGKDSNDGLTPETAFAHPQAALDVAIPGDIILLMDGTYAEGRQGPLQTRPAVASFRTPGSPAAWITLKNYPGHKPVILAKGHQGVRIAQGIWKTRFGSPMLAYLEVRGLTIRGNGDTAQQEFPDKIGTGDPLVDSFGLFARPTDTSPTIYHHLRFADNVFENCTADGLYVHHCDWVFVENNVFRDNCRTTVGFAPAGFSLMGFANFDLVDNTFKILVTGNIASGNGRAIPHPQHGHWNGNGILLDGNAEKPEVEAYFGRTLVTNNLVFNNGGGGIQMWGSHRLDLVNNTVWKNGTDPSRWGQLGLEFCTDVRIINNILVGLPDGPLDRWRMSQVDGRTGTIFRANNVYFGGGLPPIPGINDLVADPEFVNPTTDPTTADFRLKPGSPALRAGRWEPFSPLRDLADNPRALNANPSIGAYEK